ncbi:MAG: hypothetical protein V4773_11190 [Verrucomicrobiota bacterium]
MSELRHIEIVGGGLAGLSLGVALRHAGVPTTLHEAGNYPRHRVCGEFIAGLGPRTISRLGLEAALAGALEHLEVAWDIEGKVARLQRLPSPALGISRYMLDERLATAFVASGGTLHTGTRFEAGAKNQPGCGRVFATGRRPAPRSRWIGLKVHVRGLALVRELELHLGDDCYVGIARLPDDTANVCGLFRRRELSLRGPRLLLAYLHAAGLDALAARLNAATIEDETFCAVAGVEFDRRVPSRAPEGLRLGDASAMIPPFTGNGMAMAFQSAEAALDPLLAYARGEKDWPATCRATNAALRGRFRVRLASASMLHPMLLKTRPQRWLAVLSRARLLPIDSLYATLH